jgi:chemotaxis protein CheX
MTGARAIERWEEHLDRAAGEVFATMVGVSCVLAEPAAAAEPETISAVIGLAGALSGSLVLRVGRAAAERIAERLTGAAADPPLVRDAVGEVCNMVAGAWKGLDPQLSSGCLLSTPTVVAGASYDVFSQRAPLRIERAYRFEDRAFSLTLSCALPV